MRRTRLVSICVLLSLLGVHLLRPRLLQSQQAASRAAPSQLPPVSLQRMHHTVWTESDGQSLTPSGAFMQSGDGYLWFMSRNTLVRFDGMRFTRIDATVSPLLVSDSSRSARPLFVGKDGVMWLKRADGALLQYRNGSFSIVVAPQQLLRNVYTAFEDARGRVWVQVGDEVRVVANGRVTRATLPAGVPDTGLTTIVRDSGSGVWIGTKTQGLWHVHGDGAERVEQPATRGQGVTPIYQSSDGRLWAWGPKSLNVFDGRSWTPLLFNNTQIAPSEIIESWRGEFWIGTQTAGMLRITNAGVEQYSRRHGLSDVTVRGALKDRDDNLWVLTSSGIERFRPSPFTTLGAADAVPFEQPTRLLANQGNGLFVRSSDEKLHQANGGIVSGDTGAVRWSPIKLPGDQNRYPISVGETGALYFWSQGVGIGRWRHGQAQMLASADDLDATVVRDIHEDALGNVWVGSVTATNRPGLARWSSGALQHIALERGGRPGNVSTIAEDSTGAIWVNNTTQPTIYKLRGDSVVARLDSSCGIPAVVTSIVVQGVDTLWMLTNRSSLVRVVNGKATRVHFAQEEPILLPTWSTLLQHGHSLWIATNGGIARLELAALHAAADGRGPVPAPRIYGEADGLSTARSSFTALGVAAVGRDGRVWLSTMGGLAVYDERFDRPNTTVPDVHVEEVVVDGKMTHAPISPHPDRVDIHFTAISMRAPSRVRIEYMLEGADRNWVQAKDGRVATYTQLRAGHYTFRVRAWNEDGVAARNEGVLALRVLPKWYETGWLRVLAILVVLAAGPMAVYRVLQERERRRESELRTRFEATLDERARIARELHDTLLQGFGGITLQLHTVAHSLTKSPEKTADRLGNILALADNTLADARQMIWDLRAPELEHQELPAALATAARDAIVDAPITLTFNLRGEARRLPPLVEATALRVGREATTNAVRHARPSRIEIELSYSDTRLNLRVRDDGSGFLTPAHGDPKTSGHWGITGMRERAVRAGGAVDISSSTSTGTTVSLLLPITKA